MLEKKKQKLKLPVVKKNGKWFNTITKKYVSESYAKRLNSFFKRNPEASLFRAGGHGKIHKKKALTEQSRYIRELAYKRDIQLIRTKTRKGKIVYLAPFHDEKITRLPEKIDKLDYWLLKNKVRVELYRMTRDRNGIYHIITWNIHKQFNEALALESWLIQKMDIYDKIEKEIKSIIKKYPFSKSTQVFGDIGFYVYSENAFSKDSNNNKGIGFGFKFPKIDPKAYIDMRSNFIDRFDHFSSKLDSNAYMIFALTKITFYVYDVKANVDKIGQNLAKYRIGIIRIRD